MAKASAPVGPGAVEPRPAGRGLAAQRRPGEVQRRAGRSHRRRKRRARPRRGRRPVGQHRGPNRPSRVLPMMIESFMRWSMPTTVRPQADSKSRFRAGPARRAPRMQWSQPCGVRASTGTSDSAPSGRSPQTTAPSGNGVTQRVRRPVDRASGVSGGVGVVGQEHLAGAEPAGRTVGRAHLHDAGEHGDELRAGRRVQLWSSPAGSTMSCTEGDVDTSDDEMVWPKASSRWRG